MTNAQAPESGWFAVRCILHTPGASLYEERITLWRAASFDEAIALAKDEVEAHAQALGDTEYTGLAQAFHLFEAPGHASEVFPLMRESTLAPDDYEAAFFATGAEREQTLNDE